jgi:hypothetical protein
MLSNKEEKETKVLCDFMTPLSVIQKQRVFAKRQTNP